MADTKPCKKDLLQWINTVSFAVVDTQLFLNTHPGNTEALIHLEKNLAERNYALKEFAKYYGPLTIDSVNTTKCDSWSWIQSPWPWQKGGC